MIKMAGEYDDDWTNLLWDQQAAKSQRRPEWPNFNTA